MHTHRPLRTGAPDARIVPAGIQATLWVWVLIAAAWRLARLDFQPLWWDEGWSVYFAAQSVPEMLRLTAVDIHPPFYYLLLQVWMSLFGQSVLSVRLLSALIGITAVPVMYAVGRRLVDRRLGLIAALFLGISPFHVYYSQEVRMYGLVTLAGLGALYFALAWRRVGGKEPAGRASVGAWAGYVVSAAAALYTQYYAAFLLLALNLLVVGGWWRRRPVRRDIVSWLGAQAAVAALYVPWLWYAGPKLITYVGLKVGIEHDPSLDPFTYLARHLAAFQWGHAEGVLADWWWMGLVPLVVLVVAVWAFRAWRPWRDRVAGLTWPASIVMVVLLCGFGVNLLLPFNPPRVERLLLLALPAYLLAIAVMMTSLLPAEEAQRSRGRAVVAGLVILAWLLASVVSLACFYTVPRYPDDDYRPVAAELAALSTPDDAIVTVHPWQAGYLYSYLPDDETRPTVVLTPRQAFSREEQVWVADPSRRAADLYALLQAHGRVWFTDHQAMGRVLEAKIEAYLLSEAYPVLRERHGKNTILSLFAAGAPVDADVDARLGDWLALDGAAFDPGPLPAAAGVVPVDLEWRVLARPEGDYRIGLRLVGPTGHVWAQRDAPPLAGRRPFPAMPVGEPVLDRHGLLLPAGTPPGDYRLTVRVYDARDLSVLPATFAGGSGGEVTLGTVRVTRPEAAPPVGALAYGNVMTSTQPLDVEFGPLQLLAYAMDDRAPLLPGKALDVVLFWQARANPGEDYYPRLRLVDAAGATVAEMQEKPVAGTYPTAWWRAGELVRDPHALRVPARVKPGRYELAVGLVRAADGQAVGDGEDPGVVLGKVVVEGRERVYTPFQPAYVQRAPLGEQVELIGYDLAGLPAEPGSALHAEPGSALHAVLYWHALQTPERHYQAFVHLLDARGEIRAQSDGVPGAGNLPTLGWLPGEYVADPHTIPLPAGLPAGSYRLEVGLYEPVSGYRPGEPLVLETSIEIGP